MTSSSTVDPWPLRRCAIGVPEARPKLKGGEASGPPLLSPLRIWGQERPGRVVRPNRRLRRLRNRSPDPERQRRYAGATYKTNTNREIVSSVCCESTRWMSELVLVCSTQVTSQLSAMEVADDTRRVSRQVGRSARRVGEARCVGKWCEDVRRVHRGLREGADLARRGGAEHKPSRCDDRLQPSAAAASVQRGQAAGTQERETRVLPGW